MSLSFSFFRVNSNKNLWNLQNKLISTRHWRVALIFIALMRFDRRGIKSKYKIIWSLSLGWRFTFGVILLSRELFMKKLSLWTRLICIFSHENLNFLVEEKAIRAVIMQNCWPIQGRSYSIFLWPRQTLHSQSVLYDEMAIRESNAWLDLRLGAPSSDTESRLIRHGWRKWRFVKDSWRLSHKYFKVC
jgi:hypothetical protein